MPNGAYKELYKTIALILYEGDYFSLKTGGSPPDEFDADSGNVRLTRGFGKPRDDGARLGVEVFEHWFGERFQADDFEPVAGPILAAWRRANDHLPENA